MGESRCCNVPGHPDIIAVRELQLQATLTKDAWGRQEKAQPVTLSAELETNVQISGHSDDILDTLSYSRMSNEIIQLVQSQTFTALGCILDEISHLAEAWPGSGLRCTIHAPKALLCVDDGIVYRGNYKRTSTAPQWLPTAKEVCLKGLRCACIIGVNDHERRAKQSLLVNLCFLSTHDPAWVSADQSLADGVLALVNASAFATLEALAENIAGWLLSQNTIIGPVRVGIEKPSALSFAKAGVEITRRIVDTTVH